MPTVGSVPWCTHLLYLCECGHLIRADLYENSTYPRGLRESLRPASPGVCWGLQMRSRWKGPWDTLRRGQVSPLPWQPGLVLGRACNSALRFPCVCVCGEQAHDPRWKAKWKPAGSGQRLREVPGRTLLRAWLLGPSYFGDCDRSSGSPRGNDVLRA